MSADCPHNRLAGIGDEAAFGLTGQIAVIEQLGWRGIELRTICGVPLAELGVDEIEQARRAVDEAGLQVVALASRIGNWARPITSPFAADLRELDVLAAHCDALGTRSIRVMSYPNDGLDEHVWRDRVLERMSRLATRAGELGVVLLHENCAGWAGSDPQRMLRVVEAGRPALRLLFDTGNGVDHGYDARELLDHLLPHVAHVHVKDALGPPGRASYVLPGTGEARVAECLRALLAFGYSGPLSLEPHLSVRPHEDSRAEEPSADQFVAAGRGLERVLDEVLSHSSECAARAAGRA